MWREAAGPIHPVPQPEPDPGAPGLQSSLHPSPPHTLVDPLPLVLGFFVGSSPAAWSGLPSWVHRSLDIRVGGELGSWQPSLVGLGTGQRPRGALGGVGVGSRAGWVQPQPLQLWNRVPGLLRAGSGPEQPLTLSDVPTAAASLGPASRTGWGPAGWFLASVHAHTRACTCLFTECTHVCTPIRRCTHMCAHTRACRLGLWSLPRD